MKMPAINKWQRGLLLLTSAMLFLYAINLTNRNDARSPVFAFLAAGGMAFLGLSSRNHRGVE